MAQVYRQPLIIAHRGASAYLPEHTSEAKVLAYGQGADFLEQDVVATRDGALLVQHDIFLEYVTDVARRFPGRQRDDGHFYTIDFTLDEVRSLRVFERRARHSNAARYPNRFPMDLGNFRISTLEEEIDLIHGLNHTLGRKVGLYTEIKHPAWHAAHGIDLGAQVLRVLEVFGYRSVDDPVYLQCFDSAELRRLREDLRTPLKLVQLLDDDARLPALTTRAALGSLAGVVDAVGWPFRRMLERTADEPRLVKTSAAVRVARELGLAIHAYTFRREDLLAGIADLEEQLKFYMTTVGVDGVFCDHPDIARAVRSELFPFMT